MTKLQRWTVLIPAVLLSVFLVVSCASSAGDSAGGAAAGREYSGENGNFDFDPFSLDADEMRELVEALPEHQESGVRVALYEQYHSIHSDGRVDRSFRWIYQITSESALSGWGSSSVDWSPWYQNAPTMQVRVINPDGTVKDSSESDGFVESANTDDPLIFSNTKRLRLPFAGARVGSVVEEVVHLTEHQPYFGGGYTTRVGFHRGLPMNISRIVVEYPSDMDVRTKIRNFEDLEPDSFTEGGNTVMVFEARDLEDYPEYEPYLPYDVEYWPAVAISTAKDWASVSDVYSEMVEGALAVDGMKPHAASLGDADLETTVENVVAFVRDEVRYTGLLLGEKSIRPTDSVEVLDRGFGDCKDMSVMVVSLLRALDIEAWVALVSSGFEEDVDASMPGLGQFNHAIVAVPLDGGYLWIDPTALYNDYLLPPMSIQERLALVISPETESLTRVTSLDSTDNRILHKGTITLSDKGPGTWEGSITYNGALANWYRGANASTPDETAEEHFTSYYDNLLLSGELTEYTRSDPTVVTEPFRVEWTWEDLGRSGTYDDLALVSLMPQMYLMNLPDLFLDSELEERNHPYFATLPYTEEWDLRIIPAMGYIPGSLPESMHYEWGGLSVDVDYEALDDGSVRVHGLLDSGERLMDADVLLEAAAEISDLFYRDGDTVYFDNEGALLISEGRFAEGLAVYRNARNENPDSAAYARRYSNALLQAGMGQAAREVLEEAIREYPDNSLLHQNLGNLLTYDLVGRYASLGWDREGAIAEFGKALELDPENSDALIDLAGVLEMNNSGEYLGSGADLEGAIEAYIRLYEEFDNIDALWDAVYTALVFKDLETVRRLAGDLPDSDDERFFIFVADVLEADPRKIPSMAKKIPVEYERRQLLSDAENVLFDLSAYEHAAVAAREAARGTSDVMNAESRAAFYEMLATADQPFEGTDAERTAYEFIMGIITYQQDQGEALKQTVSRDMFALLDDDEGTEFAETMQLVSGMTTSTGMGTQVVVDLIKSATTVEGTGTGRTGYVVEVVMEVGGQREAFEVFVDYDGGELRVVGSQDDPALMGRHILRCLDDDREKVAANAMEFLWQEGSLARFMLEDRYESLPEGENLHDAAIILASDFGDDRAISDMRGLLAGEPDDPYLIHVMAWALLEVEEYEEAARLTGRLVEMEPDDEDYADQHLSILSLMEDWAEVEAAAAAMMDKGIPSHITHQPAAYAAMSREDWDRGEELLLELIDDSPHLALNLYNTLSWMQLYREEMDDRAMEYIMKSLDAGGDYSAAILHTAAAVLGRLDRAEDAMAMLRQSMDIAGVAEPDTDDWLVLGYIAQSYDLPEVARDAFERVEYESHPLASYKLAGNELDR